MAGHFISELEHARKLASKPRPSLVRRLGAMAAVLWALIGWVEFGPKRPLAPPTGPAPQQAVIAPAPLAIGPETTPAATLPEPTRRAARARPSVPLNGAGDGHGDDGLYVLSAAEMAAISQARAEDAAAPGGEVAP